MCLKSTKLPLTCTKTAKLKSVVQWKREWKNFEIILEPKWSEPGSLIVPWSECLHMCILTKQVTTRAPMDNAFLQMA